MQIARTGSGFREAATAFAAGAALLLASLANFLDHNEYPVLRPEVALITGSLLAIAAAMAIFYVAQRQWGRSVLEGTLALLFVDLNTDSLAAAIAIGGAIALLSLWRRISFLPAMAVIGAVIVVTTAIGIGRGHKWMDEKVQPGRPAVASNKPAILHLILDEQIGIEGLPKDDPDARRLGDELREFYLSRGFALYGGAYSQHMRTENSIPHMLNYGARLARSANPRRAVVGPTTYLTSLVEDGYELTIFQSDYADYCSGSVFHRCLTYDSSSLRPTLQVPMPTLERAGLVAFKFAALSHMAKTAGGLWNVIASTAQGRGLRLKPINFWNSTISSSASATVAFDMLVERLNGAQQGQAYFAHVLLPHYPFIVDSDCRYLPWSRWEKRRSESSLAARQHAYYAQVRCTARKLDSAINAFARSPAGRNAVIIVHGDHGSRLTRVDPMQPNLGRFSDADIIATFSTLFAVRAPGVPASYSADRVSLTRLLHSFAASDFRAAPAARPDPAPSVFIDNADWKPSQRIPLPASWAEGVDRPAPGD